MVIVLRLSLLTGQPRPHVSACVALSPFPIFSSVSVPGLPACVSLHDKRLQPLNILRIIKFCTMAKTDGIGPRIRRPWGEAS